MQRWLGLSLFLLLSACAGNDATAPAKPELTALSFTDLPGWPPEDLMESLQVFKQSCAQIRRLPGDRELLPQGRVSDLQTACSGITAIGPENVRSFFETKFTPYSVASTPGLFTGYYETSLAGSLTPSAEYTVPIYGPPKGLIKIDLGEFRPELKGQKLAGKLEGDHLVPYYTRAQIQRLGLPQAPVIAYAANPVDVFFLEVQGSGRMQLPDGKEIRLGYAAQNGHPYTPIGRTLIQKGALDKDDVSMQTIRAYLEAHPNEASEVMASNASVVFFQNQGEISNLEEGPQGGQGLPLTPLVSLAIDRKLYSYGLPFWLNTQDPDGKPLKRLMIAQDTGGAIRGVVRGDVFWGYGHGAADKAGRMKSPGEFWILLPSPLADE